LDWEECASLHTAVFQVLLAADARTRTVGPCGDPWLRRWAQNKPV
jgi:hypothetical protein